MGARETLASDGLGMYFLVLRRGEGAPETLLECEWLLEHIIDLQATAQLLWP